MGKEKLKSMPLYLPDEKHLELARIAEEQRTSKTKLVETEVDKLIKRNPPK